MWIANLLTMCRNARRTYVKKQQAAKDSTAHTDSRRWKIWWKSALSLYKHTCNWFLTFRLLLYVGVVWPFRLLKNICCNNLLFEKNKTRQMRCERLELLTRLNLSQNRTNSSPYSPLKPCSNMLILPHLLNSKFAMWDKADSSYVQTDIDTHTHYILTHRHNVIITLN